MKRRRGFAEPSLACAGLLACAFQLACSGRNSVTDEAPTAGAEAASGISSTAPANLRLPIPPAVTPRLPEIADRDRDQNRIDDELERSPRASERTAVEIVLNRPSEQAQLESFLRLGGRVRHVFAAVSYGWTGWIAPAQLPELRRQLGSALHFVAAPRRMMPALDEATRTGRVRPVWANGFAGSPAGFSGDPGTTIAFIDTGLDGTHSDLSGRMKGWRDYSTDNAQDPRDVPGHGTHVASIALGSGAAFGLGPGTLHYTNSGNLNVIDAGNFLPSAIHTPRYFGASSTLAVSVSASWSGGVATSLHASEADDSSNAWTGFGAASGSTPQAIASASTDDSMMRYSDSLAQTDNTQITNFSVVNSVANYPAVPDGFNAFRGVAPNCSWYGVKVFTDAGVGSSEDTAQALDDLVAARESDAIKIINVSLTVGNGTDSVLRAKVNTAVDNGVVVVVAAGNTGPGVQMPDPGRANAVITVGATNDENELTTYSSPGFSSPSSSEDYKPDVVAPGGSSYRSLILAADSNSADGEEPGFPDAQANDYTGIQGTSMSTPFVAGAAALVIQALEHSGTTWSFASSAQPFLVKMLLLASATETNLNREEGATSSPTLDRAQAPKDLFEGFGIVNPDAAIEAVSSSLAETQTGVVNADAPARLVWERRAWGYHVSLANADSLALTLTVPNSEDLDLYLYSGTPDANGDPVVLASSANAGSGVTESISFTAATAETAYVFVKRVSGYGSFSLHAVHGGSCGNGVLDAGEECDPMLSGSAACCDSTCRSSSAGTACDDGDACTHGDQCAGGKCAAGQLVVCAAPGECQGAGTCNPVSGQCSTVPLGDGTACSIGSCVSGACTAPVEIFGAAGEAGAAGATGSAGAAAVDPGIGGNPSAGSSSAGSGGAAGVVSGPSGGMSSSPDGDAGMHAAGAVSGAETRPSQDSSDCGCRAVGARNVSESWGWLASLLGLAVVRRRRR